MESGDNQEQAREQEKQAHYEASVPDQEKREAFAKANIAEQVKEFLWEVKSTPVDGEGNFTDESKEKLKTSIGEVYSATYLEELSDEEKQDIAKVTQRTHQIQQNDQARTAFTELLNSLDESSDGKIQEVIDYQPQSKEEVDESKNSEEQAVDKLVNSVEVPEKDKENLRKMTAAAKIIAGKERLSAEEMQATKAALSGLSRDEVQAVVEEMSDLNAEQKEELLSGFPLEKENEDPKDKEEISTEEADSTVNDAQAQLKRGAVDIETSDMDEQTKNDYRAKLARWSKRLEEMKVKKVARGIWKASVIAIIALMLLFIWELQLFGKMSKKK